MSLEPVFVAFGLYLFTGMVHAVSIAVEWEYQEESWGFVDFVCALVGWTLSIGRQFHWLLSNRAEPEDRWAKLRVKTSVSLVTMGLFMPYIAVACWC